MFIFIFSVKICLEYHDVDPSFLAGMMSTEREKYKGSVKVPIPAGMRYPSQRTYNVSEDIPIEVQTLRLRSQRQLNIVKNHLSRFDRTAIPTDPGNNNGLRAICMQLHTPKKFRLDAFRHQLASYILQEVDFFFPILQNYLNRKQLTFNSYVQGIYDGVIWCDEYMIGAIVRMFNVRISLVSPHFNDVWHIFHDACEPPDILVIVNGVDFDVPRDAITHITATKGVEQSWNCVGHNQVLDSVGDFSGFTEGQKIGLDFNTLSENRDILLKTHNVLKDINQLCRDVKEICSLRDRTVEQLQDIKIDIGDFQRLTSFFKEEERVDVVNKPVMPVAERRVEIFPSGMRAIPKVRMKDCRTTEVGKELVQDVMNIIKDSADISKYTELPSVHITDSTPKLMKARGQKVCATAPNPAFQQDFNKVERSSTEHLSTQRQHEQEKEMKSKAEVTVSSSGSTGPPKLQDDIEEGEIFDTSIESFGTKFWHDCEEVIDVDEIFISEKDAAAMREIITIPDELITAPKEQIINRTIDDEDRNRDLFTQEQITNQTIDQDQKRCLTPHKQIINQTINQDRKRHGDKLEQIIKKKILKAEDQEVIIDNEDAEVPHDTDLLDDCKMQCDNDVNVREEIQKTVPRNTLSRDKSESNNTKLEEQVKTSRTINMQRVNVQAVRNDHTYGFVEHVCIKQEPPLFDTSKDNQLTIIAEPDVHDINVPCVHVKPKKKRRVNLYFSPSVPITSEPHDVRSDKEESMEIVDLTDNEKGFKSSHHKIDIYTEPSLQLKQEKESQAGHEKLDIQRNCSSHVRNKLKKPEVVPDANLQVVQAEVHAQMNTGEAVSIPHQSSDSGDVCDNSCSDKSRHQLNISGVGQLMEGNKNEELSVYVPDMGSAFKPDSVMMYKPRKRMADKTLVTVTQTVDKQNVGTPIVGDDQLPGYYYCERCPKKFKDKDYFRKHLTRLCPALDNPEMIKCKHCEKMFRHEKSYKEHLFVHDGIKRFNCRLCGEHFSYQAKLDRHKKRDCTERKNAFVK